MKFQDFKKAVDGSYFSNLDILLGNLPVYGYQLTLWTKKGYIGRIKRGLYFFADKKEKISPELASFLLCQPSYLSMESTLSYYGIIPEIVHSQTAVTPKVTRKFTNNFGNFIYHHIDPRLFFGYVPVELPEGKYLRAEPEKALLDYFYFNLGKINSQDDIDELRMNCDQLRSLINREKINEYLGEFNNKKLEKMINLLLEQC